MNSPQHHIPRAIVVAIIVAAVIAALAILVNSR